VPPPAVRLELRHEAVSGIQTLASWQRSELDTRMGADVILLAAQDHCEDQERRTRYECVWLDANDHVIATKAIRCEPEEGEQNERMAGAGDPPKEDATMGGIVGQLMRHVENRERMLNIALSTNLKTLVDQLRDARGEADALRTENRLLRARVQEAELDESDDIESVARADAMAKVADAVVTHIVPLAAARLREGMQ
jgi:regulator of replication initiation timing